MMADHGSQEDVNMNGPMRESLAVGTAEECGSDGSPDASHQPGTIVIVPSSVSIPAIYDDESQWPDLPRLVLPPSDFRFFVDILHTAWDDFSKERDLITGSKKEFLVRVLAVEVLSRIKARETSDRTALVGTCVETLNRYDER
jgi:hypothetical protein